jgi:hypothetical protein
VRTPAGVIGPAGQRSRSVINTHGVGVAIELQ